MITVAWIEILPSDKRITSISKNYKVEEEKEEHFYNYRKAPVLFFAAENLHAPSHIPYLLLR